MARPDLGAISREWLAAKDGPYSHGGGQTIYVPGEEAGARVWDRDTAIFLAGSWQRTCDLLAYIAELEKAIVSVDRFADAIICYASTCDEHEGNRIAKLISDLRKQIPEPKP